MPSIATTLARRSATAVKAYLANVWVVTFLSGLWGLCLGFMGWFEIEPLALRLATWPVWGVPGAVYAVWEARAQNRILTVGEYALTALFAGPAIALFVAIGLGGLIYGMVEGTKAILG